MVQDARNKRSASKEFKEAAQTLQRIIKGDGGLSSHHNTYMDVTFSSIKCQGSTPSIKRLYVMVLWGYSPAILKINLLKV